MTSHLILIKILSSREITEITIEIINKTKSPRGYVACLNSIDNNKHI